MIRAALVGHLDRVPTRPEAVFGFEVPTHVPGVPDAVLDPRATWRDPATYDAQATRLAGLFRKNFEQFAERVPAAVREAGPRAK
jgi:phosphoenolpyruvate carboxykinase (ATP)